MPKIEFEQRIDVRRIAPTRWRVIALVGQAICFYGEAGSEQADFTASNELAPADIGKWRAVDNRRRLIIGAGGRAKVIPKPDGQQGEINVTFEGVGLAL